MYGGNILVAAVEREGREAGFQNNMQLFGIFMKTRKQEESGLAWRMIRRVIWLLQNNFRDPWIGPNRDGSASVVVVGLLPGNAIAPGRDIYDVSNGDDKDWHGTLLDVEPLTVNAEARVVGTNNDDFFEMIDDDVEGTTSSNTARSSRWRWREWRRTRISEQQIMYDVGRSVRPTHPLDTRLKENIAREPTTTGLLIRLA